MKLAAHHNLWLALCAVALAAVCVASILGPVRFGKERRLRERAVVVRLSAIRAAELNYLRDHGVYTADFGTLVGGGYLADSLQFGRHGTSERERPSFALGGMRRHLRRLSRRTRRKQRG